MTTAAETPEPSYEPRLEDEYVVILGGVVVWHGPAYTAEDAKRKAADAIWSDGKAACVEKT